MRLARRPTTARLDRDRGVVIVGTVAQWACPTRVSVVRGACNSSMHGDRQAWPQRTQIRIRQPKRCAPSTFLDPAIEHTRLGAEQRARTPAIAIQTAAQNGTYACARDPQACSALGGLGHAANRC